MRAALSGSIATTVLVIRMNLLRSPPRGDSAPAAGPGARTLQLYRELWSHAAGARGRLLLASAMLVASQLVKLAVPWLAAQAIDTLQHASGADALRGCLPWVAAVIGVYLACWALHGPGRVIERSVAIRVRRSLADALQRRLAEAPLAWHEGHHSAELSHRVVQASQALSNFAQSQFIYVQNAVNLIGPIVALWLLSAWIGGLALLGLAFVAATIVAFDRVLMRLARDENAAERRHAAALLDGLTHVATVLSLRLAGPTRRLVARRLDAAMQPLRKSIAYNEWKWCAVDLLGVTLAWALVVVYAWRSVHADGALLLAGVFMVHQYAQQAAGVAGSLASNLQNFARIGTDHASADPIWQAPRRRDAAPARDVPAWQTLDIEGLRHEHAVPAEPAADSDAPPRRAGLRDVALTLRAGERVVLIGPSGCGKSTLLRLLAGLYEPAAAQVRIDGAAADLHAVARHSTLIPQEAQVFEASVRENIGFDLGHDDAELLAAARSATFDQVLRELPQGLDTPIAQGGANLSGGQRQRLCLARGLLAARCSSLLLLDEPTSALDPLTEMRVFDHLRREFADACVVASVHRMSLLARFDRIVLMEAGRVVDTGTREELLRRQPLLREMCGERAPAPVAPGGSGAAVLAVG